MALKAITLTVRATVREPLQQRPGTVAHDRSQGTLPRSTVRFGPISGRYIWSVGSKPPFPHLLGSVRPLEPHKTAHWWKGSL